MATNGIHKSDSVLGHSRPTDALEEQAIDELGKPNGKEISAPTDPDDPEEEKEKKTSIEKCSSISPDFASELKEYKRICALKAELEYKLAIQHYQITGQLINFRELGDELVKQMLDNHYHPLLDSSSVHKPQKSDGASGGEEMPQVYRHHYDFAAFNKYKQKDLEQCLYLFSVLTKGKKFTARRLEIAILNEDFQPLRHYFSGICALKTFISVLSRMKFLRAHKDWAKHVAQSIGSSKNDCDGMFRKSTNLEVLLFCKENELAMYNCQYVLLQKHSYN